MEKGKTMMTVIIALLVLLLATVIAVSIMLIGSFGDGVAVDPDTPAQAVREFHIGDLETISLGTRFTTNLAIDPADGITTHIVSADVFVAIDTTGDSAELTALRNNLSLRNALARSVVINTFFESTFTDLRSPEGKAAIAEVILDRLQDLFESNLIVIVGFENWSVH